MPRLLSACPSKARAPTVRAIAIARSQASARLLARGAEHADLGLGREHARQRGRRRVGRQHPHGVAVRGQGAVAVARQPQVAPEALARQRRGDHVVGAVGELDRHAAEGDRAVVLAGDEHALCRVGRDRRQAELGALVGVLDELPDLQRALEVLPGLGEGEDLLGLQPGAHVGRQRLGHPVGRAPVVRQLGGGRPTAEAGVLAERLGERQVQRGPLAGQQVARRRPPAAGRGGRRSRRRPGRGRAGPPRRAAPRPARARGAARPPRAADGPTAGPPRPPRAARCARRRAAPRAGGTGRRAGSTAAGPRRASEAASSSSAKKALPSQRACRRATRPGVGGAPRMPATCSASSACEKAPTCRRSTTSRRSSSARNGRSGWRRCSSSLR